MRLSHAIRLGATGALPAHRNCTRSPSMARDSASASAVAASTEMAPDLRRTWAAARGRHRATSAAATMQSRQRPPGSSSLWHEREVDGTLRHPVARQEPIDIGKRAADRLGKARAAAGEKELEGLALVLQGPARRRLRQRRGGATMHEPPRGHQLGEGSHCHARPAADGRCRSRRV
eukprot:37849-Prymnesium_polylepis.1